jgi:hypothetical protein
VVGFLAHVALAGLTALAWFGLGSLVLSRSTPRDPVLEALNRIGVGAIGFALLTFAAGWTKLLYPGLYAVVFALAVLAGIAAALPYARKLPKPALRVWPRWQQGLLALLVLYVLLVLVAVSAPISSPDALLYHAADPALFERSHRIFEVPWNSSSYEPFSVEMLVLDGTLLWNTVQGAFAPFLLGLLALATVMGAAWRVAGRQAALLAGAIFFAQPFMSWETTSTFVEPGLAAAVALASWNLMYFIQHSDRRALVLAGVFAGGAAGMKYLGLIAAVALVLAAVVLLWRRLRRSDVVALALPAALVAAPWYVKNLLLTGNPFYPHLFGGLNSAAAQELARSMRQFGDGRSPLDFLLLPVRLLADGTAFDAGDLISPLFLAFAPLVLLLPRRKRPPRAILVALVVFVVGWFLTTQQSRFLLPLMPAGAVLAALGALALAARGRAGRLVAVAATSIALAGGLAASSVYAAQFAPVALTGHSKQRFLEKKVSVYAGARWLNTHLDRKDKVAVDFWSLLYLHVPYVTFGTMGDLLPPDAGVEATRAFVDRTGVTHFAILERDEARRRQVEALHARLLARVPVRSVRSRTRGSYGIREDMLVYAVEHRP